MKKETLVTGIARGLCTLTGALAFMSGMVICACETADWDKQVMIALFGFGITLAGAMLVYVANRGGEEDELS